MIRTVADVNELTLPLPDLAMSDVMQEWLVNKPVMIVVYILLALVVRWLLHRGIDRVTTPAPDGTTRRLWPRRRAQSDGGALTDVDGAGDESDDDDTGVSADESGGLTAESLNKSNHRKPAEQAVADVRRSATESFDRVKAEGQHRVADVQEDTKRAAGNVRDTAQDN